MREFITCTWQVAHLKMHIAKLQFSVHHFQTSDVFSTIFISACSLSFTRNIYYAFCPSILSLLLMNRQWDTFNSALASTEKGNRGFIGFFYDETEISPKLSPGMYRFDQHDKPVPILYLAFIETSLNFLNNPFFPSSPLPHPTHTTNVSSLLACDL